MALKNILVHLDQTARSATRLQLAVALAHRHQARLLGAFGQLSPSQGIGMFAPWHSPAYTEAAAASKETFTAATAGLAQTDWIDLNRGGETELLHAITDVAHHADLIILGQHDDDAKSPLPASLAEHLILHSGRPVLILPYIGTYAGVGKRPLFAWSDTREAARALNDALPLVEGCETATVLALSSSFDEAKRACDSVIAHLACHAIKASAETMMVENIGVMDTLLNKAFDLGADLLVMGAQGHLNLPFASRGTGTSYILKHMTVPVLMSH